VVCVVVLHVLPGIALAQTRSTDEPLGTNELLEPDPGYMAAAPRATAAATPSALPCRVLAQTHLLSLLDESWARSATFRRQCRRLADADAIVLLQGASAGQTNWDGESRIGVLANGRVLARVRVRRGRESVEVIAHEIEHVLERIDGVHPAFGAASAGSGASVAGGAYETRRAQQAGHRVAAEVGRGAGTARR
jgi:hypothetical protein